MNDPITQGRGARLDLIMHRRTPVLQRLWRMTLLREGRACEHRQAH
jgi:hypothetical protein